MSVEETPNLSESMEYNTEEWIEYLPCGCVAPPEEHEDAVGVSTSIDCSQNGGDDE